MSWWQRRCRSCWRIEAMRARVYLFFIPFYAFTKPLGTSGLGQKRKLGQV
jgi:hypothetical protein